LPPAQGQGAAEVQRLARLRGAEAAARPVGWGHGGVDGEDIDGTAVGKVDRVTGRPDGQQGTVVAESE